MRGDYKNGAEVLVAARRALSQRRTLSARAFCYATKGDPCFVSELWATVIGPIRKPRVSGFGSRRSKMAERLRATPPPFDLSVPVEEIDASAWAQRVPGPLEGSPMPLDAGELNEFVNAYCRSHGESFFMIGDLEQANETSLRTRRSVRVLGSRNR